MIKTIRLIPVFLILIFIIKSYAQSNTDKESNLNLSANKDMLHNVLQKNIESAIKTTEDLKQAIIIKNKETISSSFSDLVKRWKAVETTYIVGDLNEDYYDTNRYLDTFHQGNEKLSEQLRMVINSTDEPQVALFKNSFKTINSLEFILFDNLNEFISNPREQDIAQLIISNIKEKLQIISDVYKNNTEKFKTDEVYANSLIVNALIDSSYKLKEWRVGDSAGLSRKYNGKPNNKRSEYYLSQNSITAIQSILQTHQQIMGKQDFQNIGSISTSAGLNKEVNTIQNLLQQAIEQSKQINNNNFNTEIANNLYQTLDKLHLNYYINLVNGLAITAKIIDADGD